MAVGIRMQDLRKLYTSPPPMAAAGGMFAGPRKKKTGKKFEVTALDGITLEIHPGEIFGLLGPNGAGKSTAVGILTTRIRPTGGEAWVGEHEVWREQVQVKRLIGVVQQRPNLDFALTAREILVFHAAYFGIASKERTRHAAELLERFQLSDRADEIVRGFSGGMMQRLAIARAICTIPKSCFSTNPAPASIHRHACCSGTSSASTRREAKPSSSPRTIWRRRIRFRSASPSSTTAR